jgi:hypothetical protein
MASIAHARAGFGGFLLATVEQAADRRWLGIALLFLVFLGGTNAVLAMTKPAEGDAPGLAFALAGLVRVIALVAISVAALRIALKSPRRRWSPDGGFWLYLGLSLVSIGAAALGAALALGLPPIQRMLASQAVAILLVEPLAVWMVAAAVERPLALAPARRLRGLAVWLPPLMLWSTLVVVPLAVLHSWLSMRLMDTAGGAGFWPLVAVDGAVSTLLMMLSLGLRVTAYRSVARG